MNAASYREIEEPFWVDAASEEASLVQRRIGKEEEPFWVDAASEEAW